MEKKKEPLTSPEGNDCGPNLRDGDVFVTL
jgi:hypothetical protein